MNIPQFSPSDQIIYDTPCKCLKATMPNSIIPELGKRYMEKYGKDSEFQIYLRCKKNIITDWQKGILEMLFENQKLPEAIVQGMMDYEKQSYAEMLPCDKSSWDKIKSDGILPHLALRSVVVDDILRKVILVLVTESDGNLEEHGIAICLDDNQWVFNGLDFAVEYCEDVEV